VLAADNEHNTAVAAARTGTSFHTADVLTAGVLATRVKHACSKPRA